jgi:hypothetical protein
MPIASIPWFQLQSSPMFAQGAPDPAVGSDGSFRWLCRPVRNFFAQTPVCVEGEMASGRKCTTTYFREGSLRRCENRWNSPEKTTHLTRAISQLVCCHRLSNLLFAFHFPGDDLTKCEGSEARGWKPTAAPDNKTTFSLKSPGGAEIVP